MGRPKGIPASNKTHGMTHSPTYTSWIMMKKRCNPKHSGKYGSYYDKGITICDRWVNSFENFFTDMGLRPDGMTLDRKDNNGNYEPTNCRWATLAEQNNNRGLRNKKGFKKSFGKNTIK